MEATGGCTGGTSVKNAHITEANHHLVWGGDGIYMKGNNGDSTAMKKIWLDHIEISRVDRQFITGTTNKASTDSPHDDE
ncbi:hypothetical protein PF003_g20388 [Phytophthora fragariae]|nr:hypothetical protein PF003_g20388 [Phytophthora fragariae]